MKMNEVSRSGVQQGPKGRKASTKNSGFEATLVSSSEGPSTGVSARVDVVFRFEGEWLEASMLVLSKRAAMDGKDLADLIDRNGLICLANVEQAKVVAEQVVAEAEKAGFNFQSGCVPASANSQIAHLVKTGALTSGGAMILKALLKAGLRFYPQVVVDEFCAKRTYDSYLLEGPWLQKKRNFGVGDMSRAVLALKTRPTDPFPGV